MISGPQRIALMFPCHLLESEMRSIARMVSIATRMSYGCERKFVSTMTFLDESSATVPRERQFCISPSKVMYDFSFGLGGGEYTAPLYPC